MTTPESAERLDYFSYVCVGGPLDDQSIVSRCPNGFLLVDKPARVVWIYDVAHTIPVTSNARDHVDVGVSEHTWVLRDGSPFTWDKIKSDVAAEGNSYDVIAYGAGEQTS